MADHLPLIAFTFATFLLAGLVKGVIGLGLPTVVIGLLAVVMSPAQAAALLVVPSLATNVWQSAVGSHLATLLRRLWPMLLGICAGTFAGGRFLPGMGGTHATVALGVALVAYAAVGLCAFRFAVPVRREIWVAALVGIATGMITAATGVFVLPAVPYLQALDLDKDELVQALGLSFLVSTVALAAILVQAGSLQIDVAGASALAIVPAVIGMALGQWVRRYVPPAVFRLCFFVGLLLLGIHLVLRPWL